MEDMKQNNTEDKHMELQTIKYYKMICPECNKSYEVKLDLLLQLQKRHIYCYKCGKKLNVPKVDMRKIEAFNNMIDEANTAIENMSNEYKVLPDDDGLVVEPYGLAQEPIFAQS